MYLHIGIDKIIKTENILGIFDLDNTTVQKSSKEYLARAEKAGEVENVRDLWAHEDLGPMSHRYEVSLPPHTCRIIRITPKGTVRYQAEFASMTGGVIDNR